MPRITAWCMGVLACVRALGAEPLSENAEGVQAYANVRDPGMHVYAPRQPNAGGTGIILLPGGALRLLVVDGDVRQVIAGLNDPGVTLFVLK